MTEIVYSTLTDPHRDRAVACHEDPHPRKAARCTAPKKTGLRMDRLVGGGMGSVPTANGRRSKKRKMRKR